MTRNQLAYAALLLATLAAPGRAQGSHDPALDVVGRWIVEGTDARRTAFTGTIEFTRDQAGNLAYTRRIVTIAGAPADLPLERGAARIKDGLIYALEAEPQGLDIVRSLEGLTRGEVARRRAIYRLGAGPHVLEGRFDGSVLRAGTEVLRRAGADNDVRLLVDGPEAFPAIYEAIRQARGRISLQTFSWFDDQAGRELADLLIAKRREGVEVRCLVEAFPQRGGAGWKTGEHLRANGVEVILHHTLTEGLKSSIASIGRRLWSAVTGLFGRKTQAPREARGILNHDHRKLIVIDGRVAFTGGMNIGDKYLEGTDWHDLHCRVEGSAAAAMEATFWDRWRAAGGQGAPRAIDPVPGPGALVVDVLENVPGLKLDVTQRYLREMSAAQREILIENPYMLYDPVVDTLQRKARAGVRVIAILPSNDLNDEALARDAFLWVQNDIVRSGVEVYKYRDRMSHGKVAVFDRQTATIGTTNLDAMSLKWNAELNLFVTDRGFAGTIKRRVFDADIPASDRVKVEELGWWRKVVAGTMHLMRGVL